MAAGTLIPALPEFSADKDWLLLSVKIIKNSGNEDNTARFLALFKSLPKTFQNDYSHFLDSNDAKFDDLVKELTERFQMPEHRKFQTLHTLEFIGDRSPKQFLRDLRRKYQAAGCDNNTYIRYAFALGLPQEYRNIIFSCEPHNLDDVAARVDELYHANKTLTPTFNAFADSANSFPASCNAMQGAKVDKITTLTEENQRLKNALEESNNLLQKLSKRLDNLELQTSHNTPAQNYAIPQRRAQYQQHRPYFQHRNNNPPQRCPTPPTQHNPLGLCYFHAVFGVNAKKCNRDSCVWPRITIPAHFCDRSACPWEKYKQIAEN